MTTPRFDAHCHIFNPRYPLKISNEPAPPPFMVNDYLARVAPQGFVGGAVVSSTAQGFRQGHLLNSLHQLGAGYVGVARLPAMVSDAEIDNLNGFGVRGIRMILRRGGQLQPEQLLTIARRIHTHVGWHVELSVDARELSDLEDTLLQLPVLSLDHRVLGRSGLPSLLRLAEQGVHIKACGVGRLNAAAAAVLKDLHAANPHALMFGTGLPVIAACDQAQQHDIDTLFETLGDSAAQRVLWHNAIAFYRLQTN